MIKGFRDFIMRGNVVDLAVAVVIGTAFTAVVASFTDAVIAPVIAAFGGGGNIGFGFQLLGGNPATFVNIGAVITAAITFLITAAVLYFLFLVPLNHLKELQSARAGVAKAEPAGPTDVELLVEIRDLLREQNRSA